MARLLIVDDEETDLLVLRTILERAGHDVAYAGDGDEALEQIEASPVDVVITDLQMPKVHGLELITVLRDLEPRPGIIAVSGTGEDQLTMAEALGATKALTKPVIPEQLVAAVEEVLASRA